MGKVKKKPKSKGGRPSLLTLETRAVQPNQRRKLKVPKADRSRSGSPTE
jgi:hypothetical protein